jgi:hypothetical protein
MHGSRQLGPGSSCGQTLDVASLGWPRVPSVDYQIVQAANMSCSGCASCPSRGLVGDRTIQAQPEESVPSSVRPVRPRAVACRTRVVVGGSACAALLCACPQLLDDGFSVLGDGGSTSAPPPKGAGAGGDSDGGASGHGGVPVDGAGADTGEGGMDTSGAAGAAGTAGSDAPTHVIPWDGVDDPERCRFGAPEPLDGFGLGSSSAWGPALGPDPLALLLSANPADSEDLFEAMRSERGTTFAEAVALSSVNTDAEEGTPFLARDGLSLYFYSSRSGGEGGRDLYVAKRSSLGSSYSSPEPLEGVNGGALDHLPRVSADEKTLVFTSTRAGGSGGFDLWIATRDSPSLEFGTPLPLEGVNSGASEEAGQLSRDQLTLLFGSNRSGGLGSHDTWLATRSTVLDPFGSAQNLSELNSTADDINVFMSDDGEEIFFSSNRGAGSRYQLWRAVRSCAL